MSNPITVTMTDIEATLAKQALSGEQGEVLCDLITDHFVLGTPLTAEQKEGAGMVLKFLRSLKDERNLVTQPKK